MTGSAHLLPDVAEAAATHLAGRALQVQAHFVQHLPQWHRSLCQQAGQGRLRQAWWGRGTAPRLSAFHGRCQRVHWHPAVGSCNCRCLPGSAANSAACTSPPHLAVAARFGHAADQVGTDLRKGGRGIEQGSGDILVGGQKWERNKTGDVSGEENKGKKKKNGWRPWARQRYQGPGAFNASP